MAWNPPVPTQQSPHGAPGPQATPTGHQVPVPPLWGVPTMFLWGPRSLCHPPGAQSPHSNPKGHQVPVSPSQGVPTSSLWGLGSLCHPPGGSPHCPHGVLGPCATLQAAPTLSLWGPQSPCHPLGGSPHCPAGLPGPCATLTGGHSPQDCKAPGPQATPKGHDIPVVGSPPPPGGPRPPCPRRGRVPTHAEVGAGDGDGGLEPQGDVGQGRGRVEAELAGAVQGEGSGLGQELLRGAGTRHRHAVSMRVPGRPRTRARVCPRACPWWLHTSKHTRAPRARAQPGCTRLNIRAPSHI